MKLFFFELQKLIRNKIWVLTGIILLVVMLFRFYGILNSLDNYDRDLYRTYREYYGKMAPEEAVEELARDSGGVQFIVLRKNFERAGLDPENIRSLTQYLPEELGMDYDEYLSEYTAFSAETEDVYALSAVLSELNIQAGYVSAYNDFLYDLPKRAEDLKKISVFSGTSTFAYRSIEKSVRDYKKLGKPLIEPDYDQGVLAIGRDFYGILFLMAFSLSGAVILYSEDKGMRQLVRASWRGHFPVAFAKWAALFVTSILFALLAGLLKVLFAGMVLGFGDTGRSLQSVSVFRDCCYSISVRGYLILSVFLPGLSAGLFSCLLSLCFSLIRKPWMAAFPAVAVSGIELVLYRTIPVNARINALKFLNIFLFSDVEERFGRYANVDIMGYPAGVMGSGLVFVLLVSVISTALGLLVYSKGLELQMSFTERLSVNKGTGGSVRLFSHESYRLWVLFFGAVMLLAILYTAWRRTEKQDLLMLQEDYYYFQYGEELSGEIDASVPDWINEQREGLREDENLIRESELHGNGWDEITYQARLQEISQKLNALDRVEEDVKAILPARDRGIPVHYISRIKYEPVFMTEQKYLLFGLIFLLLLTVPVCPMFSRDTESGMSGLVRVSERGKHPVFFTRYAVVSVLYSLGFLILNLPLLYNDLSCYHLDDFSAPIQSIAEFADLKGRISIGGFLTIRIVLSFLSGIGFITVMTGLSEVCKKNSTTEIVSVILISADFLVSIMQIPVLSDLALSSGFAVIGEMQNHADLWFLAVTGLKNIVLASGMLCLHLHKYTGGSK